MTRSVAIRWVCCAFVMLLSTFSLASGQTLTPEQLTAFAARFGPLEPPPASERDLRADAGSEEATDMWIISNVIENGKAIGATGQPGKGLGEFGEAHYMTMAPNGDIFVADTVRPGLQKFVRK